MMPDEYKLYVVNFARKADQQQRLFPPIFSIVVRVFANDISEAMSLAWGCTKLTTDEYEITSAEIEGGGNSIRYRPGYCV